MVAPPIRSSQSDVLQKMFEDAVAMQRQGNHKGAIKRFKRVLKQAPDQPQVLNMCALSLVETGDMRNAGKLLEKALKSNPDNAEGWANFGVFLQKNGKLSAAVDAYDRFRTLSPDTPAGHLKFADACHELERYADARAAYEVALAINPDDPEAWHHLSRVCMFEGDWDRALEAADYSLARDPGNTQLLSFKSVAFAELGQKGESESLVDFDRLIAVKDFSAPDGYADMKAFNEALCAHSLAHPSLVFEPEGKSTRHGHQTTNLAEGDQGPMAPLLKMIDAAAHDYQATHAIDPAHPFLAQRPERWDCYIWATVLDSQGHQAAHLHPSGWLSGVYYPKVPDVIGSDPDGQPGWIEFGRAEPYPEAKAEHPVKTYQPREGMVVLFPSYFYHRTIPFEADQQRISIAFDLIPVK